MSPTWCPRWTQCAANGLLLTALALPGAPPAAASGAPLPPRPALAVEAERRLKLVFVQDEFRDAEQQQILHRKHPGPAPKPAELPAWLKWLSEWLGRLGGAGHFLADLGSVLLWLAALCLIIALVATRARWWPYFGAQRAGPAGLPEAAPLLSLQPAARLPADVAAAAQAAWQRGHSAQALSLLYRGALQGAATRLAVQLPPGATESEALRALDSAAPPLRGYLAELTRAWLALAYADRVPADFDHLLAGYRSQLAPLS